MKNSPAPLLLCTLLCFYTIFAFGQKYEAIQGWNKETNDSIKNYLNSSKKIADRKVAVFDCDGTILGQVPYYLADEAICTYAANNNISKGSSPKDLLEIKYLNRAIDTTNPLYIIDRVKFLQGLNINDVENLGMDTYSKKYKGKAFPAMRALFNNLRNYGFEIWVITASPEIVYERICHELFDIPIERVIGSRTIISNQKITSEFIPPINIRMGKREAIETFIKTKPLIVGGNSRDDLEMLMYADGLKLIVNPNFTKVIHDQIIKGKTLRNFCIDEGFLIINCDDQIDPSVSFDAEKYGVKRNMEFK